MDTKKLAAKNAYALKLEKLLNNVHLGRYSVELQKKTASNLFRYMPQNKKKKKKIVVNHFDDIIAIDPEEATLEVEGLAPYEKIVKYTLSHGFLPTVSPELKHITLGGAIVGIGIESTGFQYGFVHDGLIEADVLLPNGKIVLCNATNEYSDLFLGLPNSYGTLGYILRAKIKLYPAKSYIKMTIRPFTDPELFLSTMDEAMREGHFQFIEGLIFSDHELYLMLGAFVDHAPIVANIYKNIFYKLIQTNQTLFLKTEDYIFRYDPDWFWNIPETKFYNGLRKIAPKAFRNSGFYKKYIDFKNKCLSYIGFNSSVDQQSEKLIQDWEVPWDKALRLLNFALKNINLQGKPWAVVPIKPLTQVTLYPLVPNTFYFNLGCYCSAERQRNQPPYYNTKLMDEACFAMGGLKMLYSSTMLSEKEFFKIYNGTLYQQLKQKYDPDHLAGNLYEKVACIL